jgi:serine/threonine protein kinase
MEIDIFSTGVILFIIVQGIFPFQEAKKDEYYYNLLMKGDYETYWKKTGGQNLSADFKDLVLKMFSYDGSKRPSVKDIAEHPWMKVECNVKKVQSSLLEELTAKRSQATSASSAGGVRGPDLLDLVLKEREAHICTFHDQSDYIFEGKPRNIFDSLDEYN